MKKFLTTAVLVLALAAVPTLAFAGSKSSYSGGSTNEGNATGKTTVINTITGTTTTYNSTAANTATTTTTATANATPETAGTQTTAAGSESEPGTTAAITADGNWKQNADGTWNYNDKGSNLKATWKRIDNPYAAAGKERVSWFYFDNNGTMLTGWQWINGYLYYLNPNSDSTKGMALMNTTVAGRQLNAKGQWTVEGQVQKR